MTILITGATGHFGSIVVESLLARGLAGQLAVSVRNPGKADSLRARGVDVRQGDFDDPATLAKTFAGVDRLLLVSTTDDNATRIRQHSNAVQAAKSAGVGFIAYTSITNADQNKLGLAEVHRATEAAIRASGILHTFLRNNWYLENELGLMQAAMAGAPLRTSAGQGQVGWALRADYAEAAACVMAGKGHENKVYELGGTPSTYADLAAALGAVLGRPVPVEYIDDAAYTAGLQAAGLPDFVAGLLAGFAREIRGGALAVGSDDLPHLLSRPVTPLQEACETLVAQLRGSKQLAADQS